MPRSKLDTYRSVKASLVAFNGSKRSQNCKDGRELVRVWKERQFNRKYYEAVEISKENWQDFYATAHKLIAGRRKRKNKPEKQAKIMPTGGIIDLVYSEQFTSAELEKEARRLLIRASLLKALEKDPR